MLGRAILDGLQNPRGVPKSPLRAPARARLKPQKDYILKIIICTYGPPGIYPELPRYPCAPPGGTHIASKSPPTVFPRDPSSTTDLPKGLPECLTMPPGASNNWESPCVVLGVVPLGWGRGVPVAPRGGLQSGGNQCYPELTRTDGLRAEVTRSIHRTTPKSRKRFNWYPKSALGHLQDALHWRSGNSGMRWGARGIFNEEHLVP
jgi:hypothetical protein